MAKGRMLNTTISLSAQCAELRDDTSRLIFTWAIAHLDVEGRIDGDPRRFRGRVVPLLDHLAIRDVAAAIADLIGRCLVLAYEDESGQRVLVFPGFVRSQAGLRASREAPSRFGGPTPDQLRTNSGVIPAWIDSVCGAIHKTAELHNSGLTPELPGSTPREQNRTEEKRRESGGEGREAAPLALTLLPIGPAEPSSVDVVFRSYVEARSRVANRGTAPKLDDKRRRLIERWLKVYSVDELSKACRGIWRSEWHVQKKETALETVLRDAGQIEKFAACNWQSSTRTYEPLSPEESAAEQERERQRLFTPKSIVGQR